jgi:hypothetical protein
MQTVAASLMAWHPTADEYCPPPLGLRVQLTESLLKITPSKEMLYSVGELDNYQLINGKNTKFRIRDLSTEWSFKNTNKKINEV